MTPEQIAEAKALLDCSTPRCRHAADGRDTCGPEVHNLYCSWPACAETKVLTVEERALRMRESLTLALATIEAQREEIARLKAGASQETLCLEAERQMFGGSATELDTLRATLASWQHVGESIMQVATGQPGPLSDSDVEGVILALRARVEALEARWEALRAWAQTRYDETDGLDDAVNWAYERMMGRMNILERDHDHP